MGVIGRGQGKPGTPMAQAQAYELKPSRMAVNRWPVIALTSARTFSGSKTFRHPGWKICLLPCSTVAWCEHAAADRLPFGVIAFRALDQSPDDVLFGLDGAEEVASRFRINFVVHYRRMAGMGDVLTPAPNSAIVVFISCLLTPAAPSRLRLGRVNSCVGVWQKRHFDGSA